MEFKFVWLPNGSKAIVAVLSFFANRADVWTRNTPMPLDGESMALATSSNASGRGKTSWQIGAVGKTFEAVRKQAWDTFASFCVLLASSIRTSWTGGAGGWPKHGLGSFG